MFGCKRLTHRLQVRETSKPICEQQLFVSRADARNQLRKVRKSCVTEREERVSNVRARVLAS